MNNKKLYKSSTDKILSGVCGGLAEYLEIDATILRLVWALVVVFTGFVPGVLVYIIAAMIMPSKPASKPAPTTSSDAPSSQSTAE